MKRVYAATPAELEKELTRVMERLGVDQDAYTYDWSQSRNGSRCHVEMRYGGGVYRFENDTAKSAACGRNLVYAADLFAAVVYSLEGLARAVEQGIFTLDMLLAGVPSLPAAEPLEECFVAMGFDRRPESVEEVREHYKALAKQHHPDKGGSALAFNLLRENYAACLQRMEGK